jgi:hypothetical protein
MKNALALLLCSSLIGLTNCKRTDAPRAEALISAPVAASPGRTLASTSRPSIGNSAIGDSTSGALSSPEPLPPVEEIAATAESPQVLPVAESALASHLAFSLPSGTNVRVRLGETLDTRRNRAGDRFTATLDEPLVSGDRVVVPKGTAFSGHLVQATSSGRFKGRAVMTLALDSFDLKGRKYSIRSGDSTRVSSRHRKRNWLWIGGGAGGGALAGAAAGGKVGGLIGAGAGAAVGTIGAAVTGRKDVRLPVETRVMFRLQSGLNVRS